MKFRFGIRFLLIVTSVVGVSAWWISWPLLTASTFMRDPVADRVDSSPILAAALCTAFSEYVTLEKPAIEAGGRTVVDCLLGQQSFSCGKWTFRVVRGEVQNLQYQREPENCCIMCL